MAVDAIDMPCTKVRKSMIFSRWGGAARWLAGVQFLPVHAMRRQLLPLRLRLLTR
jgi:hypothetical protein